MVLVFNFAVAEDIGTCHVLVEDVGLFTPIVAHMLDVVGDDVGEVPI